MLPPGGLGVFGISHGYREPGLVRIHQLEFAGLVRVLVPMRMAVLERFRLVMADLTLFVSSVAFVIAFVAFSLALATSAFVVFTGRLLQGGFKHFVFSL